MDPRDLRVNQNAYFSLLTYTKQLLLMILCNLTAGIGASFQTHTFGRTEEEEEDEGQTDVEVEMVIYIQIR